MSATTAVRNRTSPRMEASLSGQSVVMGAFILSTVQGEILPRKRCVANCPLWCGYQLRGALLAPPILIVPRAETVIAPARGITTQSGRHLGHRDFERQVLHRIPCRVGNSGSGKTTLSGEIRAMIAGDAHHLSRSGYSGCCRKARLDRSA